MRKDTDRKGINKNVVLLGFTSLFTDISSELIMKIFPLFLESIGVGAEIIGVIEGVAESISSIIKMISGYLSDKFKSRKWLTFFGYLESSVTKMFLPFVSSSFGAFLVRSVERVGKGIRTAPRDALISSYSNSKNRGLYFGFHRAMDTTGAILGPLLGILILERFGLKDFRLAFKFALIPAFLAVVIILFVKEKEFKASIKESREKSHFKLGKKFYFYIFAITLFTLGNSSDAFVTIYASSFNLASTTILLMWTINAVVYAALATPLGALSDKIGRKRTIIIGYAVYGISYLGFALTKNPSFLYLVFILYGIYYAFSEGAQKAYVADLVTDESSRGTAFGIYNFGVGIMALPASVIAGFFYQYVSPRLPFYFGGGIALISSFLILFV
jgi:MFS family permease